MNGVEASRTAGPGLQLPSKLPTSPLVSNWSSNEEISWKQIVVHQVSKCRTHRRLSDPLVTVPLSLPSLQILTAFCAPRISHRSKRRIPNRQWTRRTDNCSRQTYLHTDTLSHLVKNRVWREIAEAKAAVSAEVQNGTDEDKIYRRYGYNPDTWSFVQTKITSLRVLGNTKYGQWSSTILSTAKQTVSTPSYARKSQPQLMALLWWA